MRIEELIIDGFKSYPVRTQIKDWDPSFNAITGLNGSGKSNILDAICFVLGITNMTTMRAQNQTDLIYKRGTAGVTKASVTIIFNNRERSKSPVGMEDHPSVTVMRQVALPNISKYLLNGHKASQQQIQNIFQSVQLNINNPNFVIMQGKITKVLNMKPPEILSLVEEAAGTRMFEDRKEKAKRSMDKKQRKVDELDRSLDEDITPKIDKRRRQAAEYKEYQKASTELEKQSKILHAFEWYQSEQRLEAEQKKLEAKKQLIESKKNDIESLTEETKEAEKESEQVEKRRDAEMKKGGKLTKLKEEVGELSKDVRRVTALVDLKNKDVRDEEGRITALELELEEQQRLLDAKCKEIQQLTASSEAVNDAHKELEKKLNSDEALLQTLLTGVTDTKKANSGGGGGYLGALQAAQKRDADGASEEKQAGTHLAMAEQELKEFQAKFKALKGEAEAGKAKVEKIQKEVDGLRRKVEETGWSAEKETKLNNTVRDLRETVRRLNDERQRLSNQLGRADFVYDPPQGFDTRKVKGTAAKLIRLAQENYDKTTALELAGGGKLYHVVVDDDEAAARILSEGKLRQRATLVPLNKITASGITSAQRSSCKRLAGNNFAAPALDLVQTGRGLDVAMQYVFSNTIICADAATANKITYDAKLRSVTIQGDVYDTGGTLSGGSAPQGSGILLKVQDMIRVEAELQDARAALKSAEDELSGNQGRRDQWRQCSQQLEMKVHELNLLLQQQDGSDASRLQQQVDDSATRIQQRKAELTGAQQKQRDAKLEVKKLQKDMEEFKNNKEGKIEELRDAINKQKVALQKHAVQVTTKKKELQTATLEKDQIERDIEATKKNIETAQKTLQKLRKDAKKVAEEHKEKESEYAAAEAKLRSEQAALSRFDDELKALQGTIEAKKEQINKVEADILKVQNSLEQIAKTKLEIEARKLALEEEQQWIQNDSHEFGKPGKYYFADVDLKELRERVGKLEKTQAGKKKKINHRVVAELESLETQEGKLKTQLGQVLADKEKIESTVAELDGYKRDALKNTWEKVSKDFGDIFNELLPGNFSKLEPPEGADLMDGLEVKVRLGSVWKQSLTELSGGQRSLIALSLIMALLQFKPAPMYILDEIDAALDLSHTQHIGQLFRTRFKGSQFIVVSLKDGLFTNANVLFRTKFRDGTSIVERTQTRSHNAMYT